MDGMYGRWIDWWMDCIVDGLYGGWIDWWMD